MDPKRAQELREKITKGAIRFDVPMRSLTTMRIGGPVWVVVQTDAEDEVRFLMEFTKRHTIPWYVLGGGSNVIGTDKGYAGIIIKPPPGTMEVQKNAKELLVRFSAGYLSHLAAQKTVEMGLTGFESMFGLPGTLGGAVVMNSKWPKEAFMTGDVFWEGTYITDDGSLQKLKPDTMHFSYGYSSLQERHGVLLNATFLLKAGDSKEGEKRCQEVLAYRKKTQPTGVMTSGCIFKNISLKEQQVHNLPTTSAGYLIDQAGMKGFTHGGLTVSSIHANFFVNNGTATFADYSYLVEKVREKILSRFRLQLKEEVCVI